MWGRNSEAYSECPFLSGEFAAAVIHGMRSDERGEGRFIQAFGGASLWPMGAWTLLALLSESFLVQAACGLMRPN